jgi:hypothetical protein
MRLVGAILTVFVMSSCNNTGSEDRAFGREYPNRRLATAAWDTVVWIGGSDVNDTTLLYPTNIVALTDSSAIVLDTPNTNVRHVLLTSGAVLWEYSRRGGGPGEMRQPSYVALGPGKAEAWVIDNVNGKVLVFNEEGYLKDVTIRHLPRPPNAMVTWDSRIVFTTQRPDTGIIITDPGLRAVQHLPYAWHDSLSWELNTKMALAASEEGPVVIAMTFGPGFMIIDESFQEPRRYTYIDPIPYALKVSPDIRNAGGDTARFGALSAALWNGDVAFLFGGRPQRRSHKGEPTVLIDIYRVEDGTYDRTYLLPFSAKQFFMARDSLFVLLIEADNGMPAVVGLRPKVPVRAGRNR